MNAKNAAKRRIFNRSDRGNTNQPSTCLDRTGRIQELSLKKRTAEPTPLPREITLPVFHAPKKRSKRLDAKCAYSHSPSLIATLYSPTAIHSDIRDNREDNRGRSWSNAPKHPSTCTIRHSSHNQKLSMRQPTKAFCYTNVQISNLERFCVPQSDNCLK